MESILFVFVSLGLAIFVAAVVFVFYIEWEKKTFDEHLKNWAMRPQPKPFYSKDIQKAQVKKWLKCKHIWGWPMHQFRSSVTSDKTTGEGHYIWVVRCMKCNLIVFHHPQLNKLEW